MHQDQNVNAGVLQDFRYSTEPQLQVRMLHVAVGTSALIFLLCPLTHGHRPRLHLH
jgi:hypothetical protein